MTIKSIFPALAILLLVAGSGVAEILVVKDAKTGKVIAEIELGGEGKIGDRLVEIERKEQTATEKKARAIKMPSVDITGIWIEEGVDFVRQRSIELDTLELDPRKKGLNIRCLNKDVARKEIAELKLRDVSLYHVVKAMAQHAGLEAEFGEESILLKPAKK